MLYIAYVALADVNEQCLIRLQNRMQNSFYQP